MTKLGSDATGSYAGGGSVDVDQVPKFLRCPADSGPFIGPNTWAKGLDDVIGRRSYSMVTAEPCGSQYVWQGIKCSPPSYPALPFPTMGIGVYWQEENGHMVDWDCPGYATRIIQDASGTILLAENANGNNLAANAWFSCCAGPTNGATDDLWFQLDDEETAPACYGSLVYKAHGMKFNYLFHDNHVSALSWQQTVGTTTDFTSGSGFKGMWTVKAGD
jgi:hypothetical protein